MYALVWRIIESLRKHRTSLRGYCWHCGASTRKRGIKNWKDASKKRHIEMWTCILEKYPHKIPKSKKKQKKQNKRKTEEKKDIFANVPIWHAVLSIPSMSGRVSLEKHGAAARPCEEPPPEEPSVSHKCLCLLLPLHPLPICLPPCVPHRRGHS